MDIDQPWETISLADERKTLTDIDWITDRVRSLDGYPNAWTSIDVPDQLRRCQTCAPETPEVKWMLAIGTLKERYEGIERKAEHCQSLD